MLYVYLLLGIRFLTVNTFTVELTLPVVFTVHTYEYYLKDLFWSHDQGSMNTTPHRSQELYVLQWCLVY